MVSVALFVRLEAKPGKEKEVEDFLRSGLPIVQEEPATIAWFGLRIGPSRRSTCWRRNCPSEGARGGGLQPAVRLLRRGRSHPYGLP